MDEARLAAALRVATDDVQVPRDLVRRAERAGRARRSRRRSAVTTLAVSAVVLAGGALVVPQIGSGGSDSASSTSAGAGSSASSTSPPPPLADSTPQSAQGSDRDARVGPGSAESAACDPALVVDGARVRGGDTVPVVAGGAVEITGAPLLCALVAREARYTLVLVPRGSQAPTALAEVVPAPDGSFATTVTLPAATPPGPARLSVVGSASGRQPCGENAGCPQPEGVDLDVQPPGASPEGSS